MNGKGIKNLWRMMMIMVMGSTLFDSRTKNKKPSMYKVVMLNDDYTPMEFVVHVLQKFFGRSSGEATQIMLNVHQRGVVFVVFIVLKLPRAKRRKLITQRK